MSFYNWTNTYSWNCIQWCIYYVIEYICAIKQLNIIEWLDIIEKLDKHVVYNWTTTDIIVWVDVIQLINQHTIIYIIEQISNYVRRHNYLSRPSYYCLHNCTSWPEYAKEVQCLIS